MHLNQPDVKHIINNLANCHILTVGDDERVSDCRGANETNYFM